MKKLLCTLLAIALLLSPLSALAGEAEERELTLMIYMCGSNLESAYGSATADIQEMLEADYDADKITVLLMTGGAAGWSANFDPKETCITELGAKGMRTVWRTTAQSMGDPQTLTHLLRYGRENYPSRDYALILWDHGGGPLEGVCWDELFSMDQLTLSELSGALEAAEMPQLLSWIGFDACLMCSAEVAQAMAPFAEYMIASQETEPANGWNYSFLTGIEKDQYGAETGKRIVDSYFEGPNAGKRGLTLSCLDLYYIDQVVSAMDDYFMPLGRGMNESIFAGLSEMRQIAPDFGQAVRGLGENGYDLVDLAGLIASRGENGAAQRLRMLLDIAVVYSRGSGTGLSVYHPLYNKSGYIAGWGDQYEQLDFSAGYKRYLASFGAMLTGSHLADWTGLALSEDGFGPSGENLYSLQLTADQAANLSAAQIIVMAGRFNRSNGDSAAQLGGSGAAGYGDLVYYPVSVSDVAADENGLLAAAYRGRSLYLTDAAGNALAGPLTYRLSDDGSQYYIEAVYSDSSGLENASPVTRVLYTCELSEETGELQVIDTAVFDKATQTYSRRLGFDEADFTEMCISIPQVKMPAGDDLPGVADWESAGSTGAELALPLSWRLLFFEEQLSGTPLYALLQVTDLQQNEYCTPPVAVQNPNLNAIEAQILSVPAEFDITLHAVLDTSQLGAGLALGAEITNRTGETVTFSSSDMMQVNGSRTVRTEDMLGLYAQNVAPGETVSLACRIGSDHFTGIGSVSSLAFDMTLRLPGSKQITVPVACSLSGCDTSVFSAAPAPLASAEESGVAWELLSLRKNAAGGLSGVLHVINDTGKEFYRSGSAVVNGVVQMQDPLYIQVLPHTDAYIPFEVSNRAISSYMEARGANGWHYLAQYHLMERLGVQQIESMTLYLNLSDTENLVSFTLPEPLPFADAETVARVQAAAAGEERLLIDGEITASVERMFVGNKGVSLRLALTNNSRRNIRLEITNRQVEGRSTFQTFAQKYNLLAGATAIVCLEVELYSEIQREIRQFTDIGLSFRYDDFTTHRAHILLKEPAAFGSYGGVYLSPEDFTTVPTVQYAPGDIGILPAPLDTEGNRVSLALNIRNDDDYWFAPEDLDRSTTEMTLTLYAENQTQRDMSYRFENLVLNGTRVISGSGSTSRIAPGESGKCSVKLALNELTNLKEITAISCDMTVEPDGNYKEKATYPLRFDVTGCVLADIVPRVEQPLAETEKDGITWQILSLSAEKDGSLKGLARIANNSREPLEDKYIHVLAENVEILGYLPVTVAPGQEQCASFSFTNTASAHYSFKSQAAPLPSPYQPFVLQRLGVEALHRITFLLDVDKAGTIGDTVTLTLDSPWLLPDAGDAPGSLTESLPLLEGEVSVRVTHLAVGDGGIALTLLMRNDTDTAQRLALFAPTLQGRAVTMAYLDDVFCLAPHSLYVKTVSLVYAEGQTPDAEISEIGLSFLWGDRLCEEAALSLAQAVPLGSGQVLGAGRMTARPAAIPVAQPSVYGTVRMNGAPRPVTLSIPAGEGGFDHGWAFISLRDTVSAKDDAGEYRKHDCLTALCRVPLKAEGDLLTAEYSGAVLLWKGTDPMYTEETAAPEGTRITAEIFQYSKDSPYSGNAVYDFVPISQRGGIPLILSWLFVKGETTLKALESDAPLPRSAIQNLRSGQYIHVPDDTGLNRYGVLYSGEAGPLLLTLAPAEMIGAELYTRYEITRADGSVETILADYPQ